MVKRNQMFIPVANLRVALTCAECEAVVIVDLGNIKQRIGVSQSCSACGNSFNMNVGTALNHLRLFLDTVQESKHKFYFVVDESS